MNLRAWLLLVCKALQAVVEKSWAHAFEGVGILSAQKFLSPKILKALNWESLPKVPDSLPALGQASALSTQIKSKRGGVGALDLGC